MNEIAIATTDEEILATFPLMRQLQPHLEESNYVSVVRLLEQETGYRVALLGDQAGVVCAAGFHTSRSLGWGRYLYIDDLITDERRRSSGAGHIMMSWLADYARKCGCCELRLDAAVWRHDAHRFYLRERMEIACFDFRLRLTEASISR